MLPPDVYSRPDAPDPVLPSRTVLRIVRQYAAATTVTAVDESGGEARVYFVDDEVVHKVQRPQQQRARTSLEKEAFFLEAIGRDAAIRAPRVLGYGNDDGVEYLCMSRMPGVAASSVEVPADARRELLANVGRMLRRLHSLPQEQFRDSPLFPGWRTPQAFEQRFREGLRAAVAAIQADPGVWTLTLSPQVFVEAALAGLLPWTQLVALHSNPGPEHVFINPDTFELLGLIDFGDAFISHPGFDWRWPAEVDRTSMLDGYGAEDLGDEFMSQWRACLILSDLTAVATRPSRREAALASLGEAARDGVV
jgi:aminoglycoside phosphotransferase (APT) family kinase protein